MNILYNEPQRASVTQGARYACVNILVHLLARPPACPMLHRRSLHLNQRTQIHSNTRRYAHTSCVLTGQARQVCVRSGVGERRICFIFHSKREWIPKHSHFLIPFICRLWKTWVLLSLFSFLWLKLFREGRSVNTSLEMNRISHLPRSVVVAGREQATKSNRERGQDRETNRKREQC